jgi:hypothetical protein
MKKFLFSFRAVPWCIALSTIFLIPACGISTTGGGDCIDEPGEHWTNNYTFKVIDSKTNVNLFEIAVVDGIGVIPNIKIVDTSGVSARKLFVNKNFVQFEPIDSTDVANVNYKKDYYITFPKDGDVDTLSFAYRFKKVKICTILESFSACYNGKNCMPNQPGNGIVNLKK